MEDIVQHNLIPVLCYAPDTESGERACVEPRGGRVKGAKPPHSWWRRIARGRRKIAASGCGALNI